MYVINGINYNYTTNDIFLSKEYIIERSNLTGDSNDTFPSFTSFKNALVSDVVGIDYTVKIYNNS
jgi:LEA14-like dessication related protein